MIKQHTMRYILTILFVVTTHLLFAQEDLLALVDKKDDTKKEYISNAFKSTRVINGHSMEFLGKGVLDFRILHRFGAFKSGFGGFDEANMRFGFDYGLSKNLTAGIGRSNVGKEWDGFIKYRPVWQSKGGKHASPVSVVLVTGSTLNTVPWADATRKNYFSNRLAFYNQVIIGRKFSEKFSLQLAPTFVHSNYQALSSTPNDVYALGIGGRYKISKRTAFVVDYHYIIKGVDNKVYKNPLSIGFDIETGGHVFQLHFSNATGMNEKAFITNNNNIWGKGEIRFGFNLSRVFTIAKSK